MKDEHIASKDKEILNKTDLVQQQLNEIVKKDEQIQHQQTNMQTLRTQMEVQLSVLPILFNIRIE